MPGFQQGGGDGPLIVGCGREARGDDAAGLLVARELRRRGLQAREHSGDGAALIDLWAGYERILLVDSVVTGAEPGTIHVWDAAAPLVRDAFRSAHAFGIAEAIGLARVLGRLPRALTIYGIEGESFDPGSSPTSKVVCAVESLVERIACVGRAPSPAPDPMVRLPGNSGPKRASAGGPGGPSRLRVTLQGAVQGVGFRPFVYRLATELGLNGWVLNSGAGLVVEVEGAREVLAGFEQRLERERPPAAVVLASEVSLLAPAGYTRFEILESDDGPEKSAGVLPDLATCPACLAELLDPANRRYNYPFTNCTLCGPRYTIVLDIPYDRQRTTMRGFELCPQCRAEYLDPADRRFHAQPNACPVCGPRLSMPIAEAAEALSAGSIVALKGIGGFQLLVDARNDEAVARLRSRKHREEKPFAVMMPSLDIAREFCMVSGDEARLLSSPAAPIVLLRPSGRVGLAPRVAKSSPYIGAMLPYSPLHHLLMRAFPFPVVATSGNRSDEPIATGNEEARERLGGIADVFVSHNRPVARPCDDSVVRVSRGRECVLRRARGYAPLPVRVARELPPVLAVGGHLKNTVAIAVRNNVYVSQHIGDLDTLEARRAFENAIDDLCRLYRFRPETVACDLHPDYASSLWAAASGFPVVRVQHHQAHVASCAAENDVRSPYLGFGWDGTGYGLDGMIWGSECFLVEGGRLERVAHLRPFRLPGGEAAVKEGWRSAASLGFETFGPEALADVPQGAVLRKMIERGLNAPLTTSAGRLFDAVASLSGVAQESRFEGQAAMLLELAIGDLRTTEAYPLPERDGAADWRILVESVVADRKNGVPACHISARFHNALANWMLAVARRTGAKQAVLSGGVFQNRYLVEMAAALLEEAGIRVFTHQRVPPNDGGIALGQAVLAAV